MISIKSSHQDYILIRYTILTPDIMNKVLQLTVEVKHYLTFADQNHTQYSLHSSIVKNTLWIFQFGQYIGMKPKSLNTFSNWSRMFKRKWMIKDLLVKLEKCLCKRFFSKLKPRAGNDSPMYASDPVFKKYKLIT